MPQIIDVSGLPKSVVADIQRLVVKLQGNFAASAPLADDAGTVSLDDFESILDAVSEGLPPLPLLPTNFSRADIYCEHD